MKFLESDFVMITWRGNYHFWTKSYHVLSAANNVVNPLISWYVIVAWYGTITLTIKFERKYMAFTLTRNVKVHFHWYEYRRNHAVVICNKLMGILSFWFWAVCCAFKGPCDIRLFKISTAYDVCFSRYLPSNLMLITDFALVLEFVNLLWVVFFLDSV